MVRLARDERAQVHHDALRLLSLPQRRLVRVLELLQRALVLLPLALQLLGDGLLQDQGLERVVALFFGA